MNEITKNIRITHVLLRNGSVILLHSKVLKVLTYSETQQHQLKITKLVFKIA